MATTNTRKEFTTPTGRIVAGDLYRVNDKDAEGRPLLIKNGPNAGQPRSEVYFGLAIPKGGEQHWAQTPWGALIYGVGQQCFPAGQFQQPTFSWKITDGDSQIPNSNGIKPCDREGYRGHWILNLSSGFKPKIVNRDGSQEIPQEGAVKPGYYVQVYAYADGNGSTQRPGVYLNHMAVALQGYGPEIQTLGVNTTAVGFGQGALPPGASATPLGGLPPVQGVAPGSALPPLPGQQPMMPPAGVPQQLPPGMPLQQPMMPPQQPMMPPAGVPQQLPPGMPAMPPQQPVQPVMPNPGLVQGVLAQQPMMPPPGAQAAPAVRPPQQRMTQLAQASYEQYIGSGWTEQQMIAQGVMTAQ